MSVLTSPPGVDVRYEDTTGDSVRCIVAVNDDALLGHSAVLRVVRTVEVKDSRAVNASDEKFTAQIASLAQENAIQVPKSALRAYTYRGSMIDVAVRTEVRIDDGVLFDTKIRDDEEIGVWVKPAVSGDAKGIVEPKDAFDFVTNLRAIPPQNQLITIVLSVVAALIIAFNSLVGVHDQFVPESRAWFYDHHGGDGDTESPFFKSLVGSGVLGAAVWMAIRQQLKKYMSFDLAPVPERICADDEIPAWKLVRGVSRVDLENVVFRVVACNMEKGQYKRGSGTKERTVSFTNPVRAVILYEQRVEHIPAGAPVEQFFDGTIVFEPMFRALYPPQMVSSNHGLSIHWEVQLIHGELIDQELIGPIECFPWEEFVDA